MTERRTLLRGGCILTMDAEIGNLATGDILIAGESIESITAAGFAHGQIDEVIDARGKLIIPGLIDSHLHLWQTALRGMTADLWAREYFNIVHPMSQYFEPDDMYWAAYAGALELIDHGVTSVFDYCHSTNSPEHARASLAGLDAAGIRGSFGFGFFERESATYRDRAHRIADLTELHESRSAARPLIRMAVAIDHDVKADAVEVARRLGLTISIHGNPAGLISAYASAGLLGPDMLWVHCNFATDEELQQLAGHGAHLALTPDIEMGMGKPVSIFDRAIGHDVPICLGADVVSYTCPDMLTQMHLAYALQRVIDGQRERENGHIPPQRTPIAPRLTTRQLLSWATRNGAAAMGMSQAVGSITPGRKADLVLIETEPFGLSMGDPAGHVVLQATAADIDTVIINGAIRKRGGKLLDVNRAGLSNELCASRERLLTASGYSRDASFTRP